MPTSLSAGACSGQPVGFMEQSSSELWFYCIPGSPALSVFLDTRFSTLLIGSADWKCVNSFYGITHKGSANKIAIGIVIWNGPCICNLFTTKVHLKYLTCWGVWIANTRIAFFIHRTFQHVQGFLQKMIAAWKYLTVCWMVPNHWV